MLHWKPLQQQVQPPRARTPPALVGPAALQKKGKTVVAAAITSFPPSRLKTFLLNLCCFEVYTWRYLHAINEMV